MPTEFRGHPKYYFSEKIDFENSGKKAKYTVCTLQTY
jgi:hypothetical protein